MTLYETPSTTTQELLADKQDIKTISDSSIRHEAFCKRVRKRLSFITPYAQLPRRLMNFSRNFYSCPLGLFLAITTLFCFITNKSKRNEFVKRYSNTALIHVITGIKKAKH